MVRLHNIFFSAKGTVKKTAQIIAAEFQMETVEYNLLTEPLNKVTAIPAEDVVLVSMPVYGGLIPHLCVPMLEKLQSKGAAAVIVGVYGNRDYDDALIQMQQILETGGFQVIAAGAFIAQHSVFPKVAAERPSAQDMTAMRIFAGRCRDIQKDPALYKGKRLFVKGNADYKTERLFGGIPFHPDGDRTCADCGACAKVCPTGAINPKEPRNTDTDKCISCGACIHVCPTNARDYHSKTYKAAALAFQAKCAFYKEPEVFYI